MERKICNKCGLEKNIDEFEFRKDRNNYRNTCKTCRNIHRKEYYKQHSKEILEKKRERYKIDPKYKEYRLNSDRKNKRIVKIENIRMKIKKQLKSSLDRTFTRKNLKRQKSYEELLCCDIDEVIEYLIYGYKQRYKKELTMNDEVDIDHILSLWSAYKQESVEDLCCYKNLRLLTKRDNHNRKYKITKEEQKLIVDYLDFLDEYKKNK